MLKKKLFTVLAAAAVMMAQILPTNAATWVEDSSYPGGGYFMDDDGYIIEDGSQGQTTEYAPIVNTYEDGTEYTPKNYSAAPSNDIKAATTASIVGIVAETSGIQQFRLTSDNLDDLYFEFKVGSEVRNPDYAFEGNILTVKDGTTNYTVNVYSELSGRYLTFSTSRLEHNYAVYYNYGGTEVLVDSGTVRKASGGITHTAPLQTEYQGTLYEFSGTERERSRVISYGTDEYVFNYNVYDPEPRMATVTLVDEKGNVLKTYTESVGLHDEVEFQLDEKLEINNRSYTKVDPRNKIIVNFTSPIVEYTVVYRADDEVNTDPYSVRIQYVDSNTGSVLGEDFLTVTADDISTDATLQFAVPAELQITDNGAVSYYRLADGEETVIDHAASDYQTSIYQVSYTLIDEETAYTWSIRLIDTATGNILQTIDQTVEPGTSVTFEPETQITVDDVDYVLDPGMSNRYEHAYSDASRILYVYYNEEGSPALQDYDLTIRYRSVTTDEVIYETTQTATVSGASVIDAPETYSVDDVEYVKLQGQDNISHEFYSPQRTYTIYYRDANDIQNADTVVTQEEIVTTVEPVYVDEVVDVTEAEEGTAAAGTTEGTTTVLANEETGDVTTLTDEGVPLADQNLDDGTDDGNAADETIGTADGTGETTQLEDESVPLANQDLNKANGPSYILWIGIGAVVIIAAAGIVWYVRRSRTK